MFLYALKTFKCHHTFFLFTITLFTFFFTLNPIFGFDFPNSAVSGGMGNAYSVVGHENGLLRVNPATISDTNLYSVSLFYSRENDPLHTSLGEISIIDSTGSLDGGLIYGRFFNEGNGTKKLKVEDIYFALTEHYTDALYFGIGGRRIRDFVSGSEGWDLTVGMMAKLGSIVRLGVTGYNLLKYHHPMFARTFELSIGIIPNEMIRGEIDWLKDVENGLGARNTLVKAGVEIFIMNMIGITGGWNLENYKYNTYSGGIFWRYPKGIVAYSFSSSQLHGETHMLNVEFYIFQ